MERDGGHGRERGFLRFAGVGHHQVYAQKALHHRRPLRGDYGYAAGPEPALHHALVGGGNWCCGSHRRSQDDVRRPWPEHLEPCPGGPRIPAGFLPHVYDHLGCSQGCPGSRCHFLRHPAGRRSGRPDAGCFRPGHHGPGRLRLRPYALCEPGRQCR